jgi:uncharacterized RDD family membrane protein YckC
MSSEVAAQEASSENDAQGPLPIKELAARSPFGELLVRRSFGACIDFVVLFVILLVPDSILGNDRYRATLWVWIGAQALYFLLTERVWGRTLGKLLTGTVVIDRAGKPPGILQVVVRTALRLVEVNPLLFCLPAVFVFAISKRRQRIGDLLARTYVMRAEDLKRRTPEDASASPSELVAERSSAFPLLARRAIGAQIDLVILVMLLGLFAGTLGKDRLGDDIWPWVVSIWLAVVVGYFVGGEGAFGRTLGKQITGTIVIDKSGRAPGFAKALIRTLLRLVEVNPFLIGGLPAGLALLLTKRRQRLGDLLAGTYVVRSRDLKQDNAPVARA